MSAQLTQPSEIARETLRQLAMRRIPPTPDNYQTLYCEIAGLAPKEEFPDKAMKQLLAGLPRATPEQLRLVRGLEVAINARNWDQLRQILNDFSGKNAGVPLAWGNLIRDLVTQLDMRTSGMTPVKKRESLEMLLSSTPAPDLLFQRLQNVLRSWGQGGQPGELEPGLSEGGISPVPGSNELQPLTAQLLEDAIAGILTDAPELADEAMRLAAAIRAANTPKALLDISNSIKKFSYRLHFAVEDQAEYKAALQRLLQLIVDNIGELVIDDEWLHGQVTAVSSLITQPFDLRSLDDAERRLKDVIYKQGALKKSLEDAKARLRLMLATFVDRLGDFSEATSGYHDKIESCAEKISRAKDLSELNEVLDEVMRETRQIQVNAHKSREEMRDMRRRVEDAESEVDRLQNELSQASEMVRMDPLTGTLNRKGMDEALEREVSRTRRHNSLLSVAMLDIDNFKKLNDNLGHQAGDAALMHLTQVTRETIRPQDTLARYGGEEFVVILPETSLDDAIKAMERVQRELTRRFFLHDNNRVLITFSCGVAELGAEEEPALAMERADKAMYLAKRAGKNRVMAA